MMKKFATLAVCTGLLIGGIWNSAAAQSPEELRQQFEKEMEQLRQEFTERMNQLQERMRKALGQENEPQAQAVPADAPGYLGVKVGAVDEGMRTLLDIPADRGVLVREVTEGSPAEGTLKAFDVILTINGKPVASTAAMRDALDGKKAGEAVQFEVLRESQVQSLSVTLGVRPGSAQPGPATQTTPQADPKELGEFLDRAFDEGNRQDPEPPAGGMNPFGNGQNPFGENMEGMQRQLQDFMRRMQEDPEQLQGMIERLREAFGRGGNPLNPGEGNGEDGGNPMNQLQEFLRQMGGEQTPPDEQPVEPMPADRPWLGLSGVNPEDASVKGVVVTRVVEDGPAANAGIERGDVIVSFDGQEVNDRDALGLLINSVKPGQTVKVVVLRNGQKVETTMTIGSR